MEYYSKKKKKWTIDNYNDIIESQKNLDEWNKPEQASIIHSYDFTYMKWLNNLNHSEGMQMSGCMGLKVMEVYWLVKEHPGKFWVDSGVLLSRLWLWLPKSTNYTSIKLTKNKVNCLGSKENYKSQDHHYSKILCMEKDVS